MRINPITGLPKQKPVEPYPVSNQVISIPGGFNPQRYYNKSQIDALLANFTPSGGSTGDTGLRFADGPDYADDYVYVGLEHESDGSWKIYRRAFSDNSTGYAEGSSNYASNWTNRSSLSYN